METYKDAVKRYKAESGNQFIQPNKAKSRHINGVWHLIAKDGAVVCLAPPDSLAFGARLALYYHEMGQPSTVQASICAPYNPMINTRA